MRLVTFAVGARRRLGAQLGDRVLDLQAAHVAAVEGACGRACLGGARALAEAEMPADMLTFIQIGEKALGLATQIVELAGAQRLPKATSQGEPTWYGMEQVQLMAPIPRPGKILAIGLNYSDHAAESGMAIPKNPVIFAKFATSVVGPGEAVVHPGEDISSQLDYEVELAVIIGRAGRHIALERAMDHVFGYSVMNDISARDLQFEDGQWLKGKALDTFAPFGPALVTADSVADPHTLNLRLILNGEVMQDSNTRHLIFSVPHLVSYLSRLMTLEPGDVISTGTPPGVGFSRRPPVYLSPGDVMTAEVEGVGALTNPVVAAK